MDDQVRGALPGPEIQSSAARSSWVPSGGRGTILASRAPQLLARLTKIVNTDVGREERPSNVASPTGATWHSEAHS
jgi:hypothetical protein